MASVVTGSSRVVPRVVPRVITHPGPARRNPHSPAGYPAAASAGYDGRPPGAWRERPHGGGTRDSGRAGPVAAAVHRDLGGDGLDPPPGFPLREARGAQRPPHGGARRGV